MHARNPESQHLYTDKDVARICGVTQGTVRRWRVLGRGPKYSRKGRAVRYSIAAVCGWLKRTGRPMAFVAAALTLTTVFLHAQVLVGPVKVQGGNIQITNGSVPLITISPSSLTFGTFNVGSASSPLSVSIANGGAGVLAITSITSSDPGEFPNFQQYLRPYAHWGRKLSDLGDVYADCGWTAIGKHYHHDNSAGSPQSVALSGTGASTASAGATPPKR
jgi:Helix-turn-helix domain